MKMQKHEGKMKASLDHRTRGIQSVKNRLNDNKIIWEERR